MVLGKLEKVMFIDLSRSSADERCFWRRKTELGLLIIEKLEPHQFVLWLRASEWEAFEDDFWKSALCLKGELLRFDTAQASSREVGPPRLRISDDDATPLTTTLEIWMKSTRDESSRILVILDDLDSLDIDHHRTISRMFAANTLDLIHTARDPLMAEKDMVWEARDFEVSSLQGEHVAGLLQDCMEDSRRRRNQRKIDSTVRAVSGTDRKIAEK